MSVMAVATQVGSDDGEVLAQRFEDLEPVETAAGDPAVQQYDRWRARGPIDAADERRATAPQSHPSAQRQRRNGPLLRLGCGSVVRVDLFEGAWIEE